MASNGLAVMIIDSPRTMLSAITGLWTRAIPIALYIGLITWLDLLYHFEEYHVSVSMVTIPGTVIGLLLAFRTNSCYGRWWEARILWGAIVNDSRTWVRQLIEFTDLAAAGEAPDPRLREMAYRQAAWCYALARNLRGQNPLTDVEQLLEENERTQLATQGVVPNAILLTQARQVQALYRQDALPVYQAVELEKTLGRLTDSMGGCERIKHTTFPTSYRCHPVSYRCGAAAHALLSQRLCGTACHCAKVFPNHRKATCHGLSQICDLQGHRRGQHRR